LQDLGAGVLHQRMNLVDLGATFGDTASHSAPGP
jgi:hypothetical protein